MAKGKSFGGGPRRGGPDRAGRKSPDKAPTETDPLMKGEWAYLVGKIEDIKGKGAPKRKLSIGEGKSLTEEQVPFLKDHKLGDLIAVHVHRGSTIELSFAENLGKAGTIKAELARHAYSIGNGDVFPPPVEKEAEDIQKEGERMIQKELAEKKLISANDAGWRESQKQGESRADFREMKDKDGQDAFVMTIDPDTARDYDDALHARKVEVNGKEYVEVGVHIADVTQFLSVIKDGPGSAMFNEAMMRSLTAYFPHKAFTMLPRILSETLCSLEPDKDRLTLSTVFLIDPATNKVDDNLTWIGEGVIQSGKRFTYKTAEDERKIATPPDLDTKRKKDKRELLRDSLHLLEEHGLVLRKEREDRKSATFPPQEELEAIHDELGMPIAARTKESLDTNYLVEDWMIKANESFATFITRKHEASGGAFPTLLRYHEAPPIASLEKIAEQYEASAILEEIREYKRTKRDATPKIGDTGVPFENKITDDLMKFAQTIEISDERKQRVRDAIARDQEKHLLYDPDPTKQEENLQDFFNHLREQDRKWMKLNIMFLFTKAKYTTDLSTHFGLSLFPYTHATSPIRRFADVLVHHLIKQGLAGNDASLPEILRPESIKKITAHINARELLIRDASDKSKRMWAADMLSRLPGDQTAEMEVQVLRLIRRQAGAGPQLMEIQVPLKGGYRIKYEIPVESIRNIPSDPADVNRLIGHSIKVKLLGVDLAAGTLDLEYLSAPVEAIREELTVEKSEFLKNYLLEQIQKLKEDFRLVLAVKTNKSIERELQRLKSSIENMTQRTPSDVADKWAGTLGVLNMRLHRAAVSAGIPIRPPTSAAPRPDPVTTPTAEPPRAPVIEPAPEPEPVVRPTSPVPSEVELAARARRDRIAALERELESLQRQRRLKELEVQLASLKSKK